MSKLVKLSSEELENVVGGGDGDEVILGDTTSKVGASETFKAVNKSKHRA